MLVERDQRAAELRRLRLAAGLSQREVGERAGVSQSNIAAYEAGRRPMSEDMIERIVRAMRRRPSEALRAHRSEVERIATRHGATAVHVFGSVARGEDGPESDVDLLVSLRDGTNLFDLVEMERELERLLGCRVDVVSTAGLTQRDGHIRRDAVAL